MDIAPYLRSATRPTLPTTIEGCGEIETATNIRVIVEADGVASAPRKFIAAKIDRKAIFSLLTSQQLHRTMERDEFDIIPYFSWPEVVVDIDIEFIGNGSEQITISPPPGGQRAVAVTARGREGVDAMRVTFTVDGTPMEVIEYELKPNLLSARRVAWLNTQLSPELYTFPLRKGVLVESTRRHMESVWGREAASVEAHNELKLLSAYEPERQLRAIAEILYSPRVWLIEGSDIRSVLLATDRVLLSPSKGMGIVEVDIRAAEEGVELW